MTKIERQVQNCLLVTVAGVANPANTDAALRMVVPFGGTCRTLLVTQDEVTRAASDTFGHEIDAATGRWRTFSLSAGETSVQRGTVPLRRAMTDAANSLGLEADIAVTDTSAAVADIEAAQAKSIVILMQPADPLLRQTHPFATLRRVAFEANASTLMVPENRRQNATGILVIAGSPETPEVAVAKRIAKQTGEDVSLASSDSFDWQDFARRLPITSPPALIVKMRTAGYDDPNIVSRVSRQTGTPVLLLEPGVDDN